MADPIEVALWEQRVAETSERLAQSEEREAVLEQMQAELNAQSARVDELRAMLDAGGADMIASFNNGETGFAVSKSENFRQDIILRLVIQFAVVAFIVRWVINGYLSAVF